MHFTPTAIPDVILIEPQVFGDDRGFFMETYQQRKFAEGGITASFVQDNHSGSQQGILRGLHYQLRQPQGKLVRVVAGEVFDVAVDLRRSSPSFGRWVGEVLSSANRRQLWIPPGFGHGFYVVSEWAEVVYKATSFDPTATKYLLGLRQESVANNDSEVSIGINVTSGNTDGLLKYNMRTDEGEQQFLDYDPGNVFDGDYHYAVLRRDSGSTYVRGYLDGSEVITGSPYSLSGNLLPGDCEDMHIAALRDCDASVGGHFNGIIDLFCCSLFSRRNTEGTHGIGHRHSHRLQSSG